MTVGVIYGAQSGIVRRVIADDNSETAQFNGHVGQGEALLMFEPQSVMLGDIIAEAEAVIANNLGKKVEDLYPVHVVVRDGVVIDTALVDPVLDPAPNDCTFVKRYSDEIVPGVTYDQVTGLFTRPSEVAPESVNKKTGLLMPEKTIPAIVIEKPTD